MAIVLNALNGPDELSAVLRRPGENTPIVCISVELTQTGFEIASAEHLELGTFVDLVMVNERVQLQVEECSAAGANRNATLYRLKAHGNNSGFQEMLKQLIGIQVAPDGSQSMTTRRGNINGVIARAKRLSSIGLVGAHVKTWGTRFEYPLATADLSRTGALLISDGRESLPFQEGTLLEIRFSTTLIPNHREIFCTAKVVRRSDLQLDSGTKRCQLGVQLIDLDSEVLRHWESLIFKVQAVIETALTSQGEAAVA